MIPTGHAHTVIAAIQATFPPLTGTVFVASVQMTCYCHKSEIIDRGLTHTQVGSPTVQDTQYTVHRPNQVTGVGCLSCTVHTKQLMHLEKLKLGGWIPICFG